MNVSSDCSQELVVVIHGLGSHRWLMLPMKWQLERADFETINFGYRSFFGSIEQHARSLEQTVQPLEQDAHVDRWHVVCHSMGAVITRQLLRERRFEKLHRIVMLGPPNHGSPAARRSSQWIPWSPAVRQISDHPESHVRTLGPQDIPDGVEIGVLAGSYDWVVSEASSRLSINHAHKTIFSGHNGLLVRPRAAQETVHFLRTGGFFDEVP